MTRTHAPLIQHPFGITTVDAEYLRPGFASVHLVVRGGSVGIIDSGANSSVPFVERALAELGVSNDAVEWLFLTHVHLDHAGGAGLLLERLPRARVIVHPRGAAHLVDPARLESATIAVYGKEAYAQLYGALRPIPSARVQQTADGECIQLAASEFTILHTPGHALHHQVLFDREANAAFTGDTFGVSYRELDTEAGAFIVPTTTPTQFDPEQLLASIRRIEALAPDSLYLTHFGRVTNVPRLGAALQEQIEHIETFARKHAKSDNRLELIRSDLRAQIVTRAEAHGIANAASVVDRVLGPDLELNTHGIVAWLARLERA